MNEQLLQVPCELVKAEMRSLTKDAKLTFTTQEEVPASLLTQIIGNTGRIGWLAFLVGERRIDTLDVVGLPEITRLKEEKSPSKMLRDVLWCVWDYEKPTAQFETFYAAETEKMREHYKKRLPKD